MSKIKTIFDWVGEITVKKSPTNSFTEDDWSKFNSFMIHKFISQHQDYIDTTNEIQKIPHEKKQMIYSAYRDMLPKQKVWDGYIGSKKTEKDNINISYLAKHFECSEKQASEYANSLGEDGIQYYMDYLGVNVLNTKKKTKKK